MHYKLDLGIDHVLIDEAQDTSPKQWEIIQRARRPSSSPARARAAAQRTIFAVGDEKQSIFSFQGAAPREFDDDAPALRDRAERRRRACNSCRSSSSTRFAPAQIVLGAVDEVFGTPGSVHAA